MKTPLERRAFLKLIGSAAAAAAFSPALLAAAEEEGAKGASAKSGKKILIAHRGASAYRPENTLESYKLALAQGADYVEQDLQVTKDGVLVCCHDSTLERTTNVEEVFPDRFKEETVKGKPVKRWYIHDLTLKELKQLDAGSFLKPEFKGVTIPTWQEAIDLIRGKAGLCPETKGPKYYGSLGINMEQMVADLLKKNGLDKPAGNDSTPVLLQSFSKESLLRMRDAGGLKWPLLQLTLPSSKWGAAQLKEAKEYAWAVGPGKPEVNAAYVKEAHATGLKVIPYTFSSTETGRFKDVREEMNFYLHELGIDGLFTNNPDQFPREPIA